MSDEKTTFEEARKCPRCSKDGEVTRTWQLEQQAKMHQLTCRTPLCPWFETNWIVQIDSDGNIPDRSRDLAPRQPESFPKHLAPVKNVAAQQDYLDRLLRAIEDE